MAEDRKHEETLHRYVADLVAIESDLAYALGQQQEAVQAHVEAAATVQRLHEIAANQRAALEAHLQRFSDDAAEPSRTLIAALFDASAGERDGVGERSVSDVLREDYTAINYAAISYAALCELAFRLYDPPLREIAPQHLRAYARAAQEINQLIARVVAWELQQQGLECRCICPMCGMGACGCVAVGTRAVNAAWSETAPSGEAPRGFLLLPPRSGSPLALAGVQGGERLLEVDGEPVQSLVDIQTAIRKHPLGEEVRVLVQRGTEAPREVRARHVSDYPST
jgi:PDZ domain